MKRYLLVLLGTIVFLSTHAQPAVDFNKFPLQPGDTTTIYTADLLAQINWAAIKDYCKATEGHYVYEKKDSLIVRYSYIKQGRDAFFDIVSYNGVVMEYTTYPGGTKPQRTSYLNKTAWLAYADKVLPGLADKYKLSKEEPDKILKSYYRLLGVDTRDEYGFICEYSTFGSPPERRVAVMSLLREHRLDLIRRLTDYPNLQTRLYAVDALIYTDYFAKQKMKSLAHDIEQDQKQLTGLQKNNDDTTKIKALSMQIKISSDSVAYYASQVLTAEQWKMIYGLRDSGQEIKTCGNSGSYKIYGTPVAELLSDQVIADVPKWYERLKNVGSFFR